MSFQDEGVTNDALLRINSEYGVNASTRDKSKSIFKFGKMDDLDNNGFRTVTQLEQEEELEVIGSNAIDTISSSNNGDVGLTVDYEGLYYENGRLRFGTGSSVLNGRTGVALNRGYNELTRASVRGQPDGDVWFGEGALNNGVPPSADRHNVIRGTEGYRQTYRGQTSFSHRDWGIVTAVVLSLRKNTGSTANAQIELQVAERVESGQPIFYTLFSPIALRASGSSALFVPLPGLIVPANHYVRFNALGTQNNIGLDVTMFCTIAIDRELDTTTV